MIAKTRKAPTGPKHDRCIGHVEHPYPAKGMLCYGAVIGEAGMVSFADHLAETAAAHRAADLAEREAMHLAARPGSVAPTAKRSTGRKRRSLIAGAYAEPERTQAFSGPAAIRTTPNDAAKLAELVARYRAMRGLDTPAETPAPVVRKARAPRVEPVQVAPVVEPAPIVEPIAERSPFALPDPIAPADALSDAAQERAYDLAIFRARKIAQAPKDAAGWVDGLGYLHCLDCAAISERSEPVRAGDVEDGAPCEPCGRMVGREPIAEPDTYAAAVAVAETRPDPCAECGHPSHGATCAICDDSAQVGTYAPCTVVAPVQAPAEPTVLVPSADIIAAGIAPARGRGRRQCPVHGRAGLIACDLCGDPWADASPYALADPAPAADALAPGGAEGYAVEPAPVLSAPSAVSGRPTCDRCGQVFRKAGAGAEWHRVNRPDCAGIPARV